MKIGFSEKHGDKLLAALALVFLAAALFRLSSNQTPNKPDPPTVIFTHWWEDGSEKEILYNLISEFEDLHDEIKIILSARPYEDLRQALFNPTEALSEGDRIPSGDIIALDPLWIPELLKGEIIESAHPPFISSVNVFCYNIDILSQAGFSRPPKTRSEFLDYTRILSGREGNRQAPTRSSGLALGLNSSRGIYDDIFPWMWAAGAQLIQDGKPTVASRPVIEGLTFLAALHSEGLIAQDAFSAGSGEKLDDFISGRAAFMIAPTGDIRFVRERMGDEAFGFTSIPVPDNYAGRTFFGTAGWTVGVHSASTQKEEAKLFMDFLAEKAPFLLEQTGTMPGTSILSARDDFYLKVWDIAIAGESAPDFSGLPWTELEEAFREELAAMLTEKSSPTGTAVAIQKKWEAILDN